MPSSRRPGPTRGRRSSMPSFAIWAGRSRRPRKAAGRAPISMPRWSSPAPACPGDHRPLFIFGSPMGASGFGQLVSHFGDRTVITYDPRGMGRSSRTPGSELTAETHAEDYHRVIEAAGVGPVDAFGSSGGGMCALHWVVAHPEDVNTLVSHEPPLVTLLEDREIAIKVNAAIVDTYQR